MDIFRAEAMCYSSLWPECSSQSISTGDRREGRREKGREGGRKEGRKQRRESKQKRWKEGEKEVVPREA